MVPIKDDKRMSTILWIVGIMFTGFLGVGATQMISYGETKQTVEHDHALVDFIAKDYMPGWYGAEMVKLMNIHTERVIATLNEDSEAVKRLNIEFEATVKVIQDNFIRMRGGMTNITRGGNSSNNNAR